MRNTVPVVFLKDNYQHSSISRRLRTLQPPYYSNAVNQLYWITSQPWPRLSEADDHLSVGTHIPLNRRILTPVMY